MPAPTAAQTVSACGCTPPAASAATLLLQHLAIDTWDRLSLSHHLGIPTGEQTITDINLLEIVRANLATLRVYKAQGRNEPEKGFDWEWWVGGPGTGYWRYSIQAKKLNLNTGCYQCVRHAVGPRWQIDILEDFARAQHTIPLYCLYNAAPAPGEQEHWHCARPFVRKHLGCSLAPLGVVRPLHRRRIRRTFARMHQDPRVLPWHCILAPSNSKTVQLPPPNPFAPLDYQARLVLELPAFLRGPATNGQFVELPSNLYRSGLGGEPRWVMVLDAVENG